MSVADGPTWNWEVAGASPVIPTILESYVEDETPPMRGVPGNDNSLRAGKYRTGGLNPPTPTISPVWLISKAPFL